MKNFLFSIVNEEYRDKERGTEREREREKRRT